MNDCIWSKSGKGVLRLDVGIVKEKNEKQRYNPPWKWWGDIEENRKIGIAAILSAAYFICMPLSIVELPGGISLLKAVSYVLGLVLVIKLFIGRERLQLNSMHSFLAIYVVYSIFSWFLIQTENAFVIFRGLLETSMIFAMITVRVYNKREENLLIHSWILVGLVTTVSVLLGQTAQTGEAGRVTLYLGGGAEDPNQLCGYFILPMLCCLKKLRRDRWVRSLLYLALVVLMGYCVILTGSRGGLLAVVAALAAYVLFAVPGWANRLKAAVAMALLASVFWTVAVPLLPQETQERFTIENIVEGRGTGRYDIWAAIVEGASKDDFGMLFGYGFGATQQFVESSGRENTVAHNHWLQIWSDQGFLGAAIFGLCFLFALIRNWRRHPYLVAAMLGMLVLSMSLTMYPTYKPFWNVLMMAAINVEPGREEERHETKSECGSAGL